MNPKQNNRGISLMETVVSMLLVTFVIGSTLATVGPVVEGATYAERRLHAARLGDELMSEVLSMPYKDPDKKTKVIGLDSKESYGDRTTFDDVDDYAAYIASPAEKRDGSAAPGSSKYTQYVDVDWVDPVTLKTGSSETGLKKVTVRIFYNSTVYFSGVSLVSEDDLRGVG